MSKKPAKGQVKAGRGSAQFLLRFPPGMRNAIAAEAEANGRSMNAEIVARLALSFEDRLTPEGVHVASMRVHAAAEALENLLFDLRDMDLDAFILDRQKHGQNLTRTQAIRFILTTYLAENGFLKNRE